MYVRVKRAKSDIGRIFMKVLVLNPGATSTKISIFEEENEVFKTNLVHHAADLAPLCPCD